MNCPGYLQNQSLQNGYSQNECTLAGRFPVGQNGFWHSGIHVRGKGDKKIYPIIKGCLVAYYFSDTYAEFSITPELSEEGYKELDSCETYLYEKIEGTSRRDHIKYTLKEKYKDFKYQLSQNFIMLRHNIKTPEGNKIVFFTLYVGIAPPIIEEKNENRISCREGYMPFAEIEKETNEPTFYETYEFRVKNSSSVTIYDSPGQKKNGDTDNCAHELYKINAGATFTLVNAALFRENYIAQTNETVQYVRIKNNNARDEYLHFHNSNYFKNILEVRIIRNNDYLFNGQPYVCADSPKYDLDIDNLLGFTLPHLPPMEPDGSANYHSSRYDLILLFDNVDFLNTSPFNDMGYSSFINVGEINASGRTLWEEIEREVNKVIREKHEFWQRVRNLLSDVRDWFYQKYPNEKLEARELKRRIICRHPLEFDAALPQYRRANASFMEKLRSTDIWEKLRSKIIMGLNGNSRLTTNMFWFAHPIYFIEQLENLEIIKNEFKIPYPNTFWNQFSLVNMKGFREYPLGTQCNFFLHHITREFGIYKNIFPKSIFTNEDSLRATNIKNRFNDSRVLNNRQVIFLEPIEPITQEELEEIPQKKRENINIKTTNNRKEAAKRAHAAQLKANEGFLVIAVLDINTHPGHVAIVGPQNLTYNASPQNANFENTTGNDIGDGILYQYPVFVQAGSRTGIVNPRSAFNGTDFDNNRVYYYVYKPRSDE